MHWLWTNTTQVGFGQGAVREHLPRFVKGGSKVLCTFGGGSIDKNGARDDVTKALEELKCTVLWEGGIPANPEFSRLMEIVKVVKTEKPDLLLAIGGGSVLDGTKFISLASKLEDNEDPWLILSQHKYPSVHYPVGAIMTLPATGSEWNSSFVISRRATEEKLAGECDAAFPVFSLLDPKYTMTLPLRQIRNGLFDGFAHCLDQFMTEQSVPMMDNFWMSIMKELVDITDDLIKPESTIEMHERLICATTFALNFIFTLGKDQCWAIHRIGHLLTAKYGIDHASSLSIIAPNFLEETFDARKELMAKADVFVFGSQKTDVDSNARSFISNLRAWIVKLKQPLTVTGFIADKPPKSDIPILLEMIMKSVWHKPFGFHSHVTAEIVKAVLEKSI